MKIRLAVAIALFLNFACSSPNGSQTEIEVAETLKKEDSTVSEILKHPSCTSLKCIEDNEGKVVQLVGSYEFPKQKAFAQNKLILGDGTKVIVGGPREGNFVAANDGAEMRITGRVFTKDIPEKYQIIGRNSDPRVLEITEVRLSK
mgnify:CR=1 FL=1